MEQTEKSCEPSYVVVGKWSAPEWDRLPEEERPARFVRFPLGRIVGLAEPPPGVSPPPADPGCVGPADERPAEPASPPVTAREVPAELPVWLTVIPLPTGCGGRAGCPACGGPLGPGAVRCGGPARALWSCDGCGACYLVEAIPGSPDAVAARLPGVGLLRIAAGR